MVPLQPLSKSDSYHDCRLDSHDSCLLNIIFNQGRCACTFASKMRVCAHAPPPLCVIRLKKACGWAQFGLFWTKSFWSWSFYFIKVLTWIFRIKRFLPHRGADCSHSMCTLHDKRLGKVPHLCLCSVTIFCPLCRERGIDWYEKLLDFLTARYQDFFFDTLMPKKKNAIFTSESKTFSSACV